MVGFTSGVGQARARAKPVRALALTVLVVLGIVLTDMAALREEKGDAMELSMTSYFDSLARRDAAAADGPRNSLELALMQAGAVPSPSVAHQEVSDESSKALGGGLEDARRGAARRLAPTATGAQTQPRRRETSDIAADMKDMLRSVCRPPLDARNRALCLVSASLSRARARSSLLTPRRTLPAQSSSSPAPTFARVLTTQLI